MNLQSDCVVYLILGFRVMAFVQKAVARLYEPEKLETLLQDLGKKHFGYGAKQKYVDVSSSDWNVILMLATGNIKTFRIFINVISSFKPHFCKNVLLPLTGKLLPMIM
jgi:hypothetical protein